MRIRRGFNARELLASLASDSRAYQYRPLPSPTSIRLLEVHPASPFPESSGGSITVSLRTFPVDDAPPFQALSYTWGYPLIPESRPSRSSNWRRLAFVQRVQARSPRLLDPDGHGVPGSISSTGTPSPFSGSQSQGLPVLRTRITENTPCFPVKCEGRNVRVTANLHDALAMLARRRNPMQADNAALETKYIWVDALCIDQSSLAERNQQVNLMADIFKAARGVIVWLGEEDEFTQDACTVMERIAAVPREKFSAVPYTGFYDEDGSCYRELGIEPLSYQNWLGLIAFMNRPWFSRCWVVQELALARKATVVCGSRLLQWEQLARTIEFIRATKWYHHLSTEKMRHIRALGRSSGAFKKLLASNARFGLEPVYLNNTRNALQSYPQRESSGGPSLRVLLDTHRYTAATDPRDKVYAFLSLSNAAKSSPEKRDEIKPNYQTPVRQVYTEAACTLIRSTRNLNLLSHVQDRSLTKVKGLPSWVPDYSVPLSPYPLEFRGKCNWSACGNLKWRPPSDQTTLLRGLLPVQGFHIDTIAEKAIMPHEATDAGEPWASIVDLVFHLPNPYSVPSIRGAPISRLDVLWRTLTTNTYSRQHPAPSECGALFIDYILNLQIRHRLAPWSSHDTDFQPHQTPFSTLTNPDWHSLLASEPANSPYNLSFYRDRLTALVENMLSSDSYSPLDLAQFHHDIEHGSGRLRRLFRTKDMLLLGTGPQSLRVGDEVWILAGGKVPYILRPIKSGTDGEYVGEKTHRLVGEAYVHGVMHGDPHRFELDMVKTVLV
ncbi:uncharacterized protein Z520_12207 [Fonsecaea multimorphosa CBS 102226]|uniref:Heterokaryon incompatibility domain-containing protein n=1 Tax=Fonsecaea multimorphosa CBS 102226 TaxID=1442371 RepID=A0A0D2K6R2_9EURO|nr:uncharacterized protein Z520_12207 [Fonsecaea multimorphosa CBS 102226]KIX92053.1 hypothetical protein Z520_12207 [Fonsecaea multimorphosa CBS 102226]OAL17422.1 hypothetical protein AYO22_11645 [Fonsecaea multimorphosa]